MKTVGEMLLATEWADDPIDLELKVLKAERDGWSRIGRLHKQMYDGTGIPVDNYVQSLSKPKKK